MIDEINTIHIKQDKKNLDNGFYNKPIYRYDSNYNGYNSKYRFKYGEDGYEEGTLNLDGFKESDYKYVRYNELHEDWYEYSNEYSDEYNEKIEHLDKLRYTYYDGELV